MHEAIRGMDTLYRNYLFLLTHLTGYRAAHGLAAVPLLR